MNLISKFLNSGAVRRIKVDRSGKNVAPLRPATQLPEVTVTPELAPSTYFMRDVTNIGNGRSVVGERLVRSIGDFDSSGTYGRTIYNSPEKSDTVYWGPSNQPENTTWLGNDSGWMQVSGSPSTEEEFNRRLLSGKYKITERSARNYNDYLRIYNAAKLKLKGK